MIKRTKGRLLLVLLVITGLAGTITDTSLTQKERKYALSIMRESRNIFPAGWSKGFSKNQFNYKSPCTQLSIKKCVFEIALNEKQLWEQIGRIMQQPANPEKRAAIKITDARLVEMALAGGFDNEGDSFSKLSSFPWKTTDEAINNFRNLCSQHIRYIKTSTEDLRNHVVPFGNSLVDCYQLILVTAASNVHYSQLIDQMKTEPGFPAK